MEGKLLLHCQQLRELTNDDVHTSSLTWTNFLLIQKHKHEANECDMSINNMKDSYQLSASRYSRTSFGRNYLVTPFRTAMGLMPIITEVATFSP